MIVNTCNYKPYYKLEADEDLIREDKEEAPLLKKNYECVEKLGYYFTYESEVANNFIL